MKRSIFLALIAAATLLYAETNATLKEQVRKTEIAFLKTMADWDAAAFALAPSTPLETRGQMEDRAR